MVEPITATATAIAILVGTKAVEKVGEKLGEGISTKIGEIVNTIRTKLKSIGMDGALTQAQENPNEATKTLFQQVLEMQMKADDNFAQKLIDLKQQLDKMEGSRQIMAEGANFEEAEIGEMKQKGGDNQEMANKATIKKTKIQSMTQEN